MSNREKFEALLVGPIDRFDQRNDMFRRAKYEPEWVKRSAPFRARKPNPDKAGHGQEDYALIDAAWYVEHEFAMGNRGSGLHGLYAWEPLDPKVRSQRRRYAPDPADATKMVKRAARFFGASLVGVCALDRRWLYSHVTNDLTEEHSTLSLSEDLRYAVAMAVEMDYDYMQTAPTGGAAAATGLGYSKMAFIASLLAQFIRGLGYRALPSGNDTALSIPIAVEAGLGELGRNGLLISEEYGPRVRICKVFTDLPLSTDEPRFFGVTEFCQTCMKCATDCPSKAISFEERTTVAPTQSNNPGVLKWPVNPEQCYKFWIANRLDCANCIRVCPFNQQPGRHHDLVRAVIKRTVLLNPLILRAGDLLQVGKQQAPSSIWEDGHA